jgi:hypothetical protein
MDEVLADLVRRRAGNCCEYCRLPQAASSTRFQIDHIIAEQHGGKTVASNLALSCLADNNHKGPNLAGIDPRTGKKVWLFNPRRHSWSRHFQWNGPILLGARQSGAPRLPFWGLTCLFALPKAPRLSQRISSNRPSFSSGQRIKSTAEALCSPPPYRIWRRFSCPCSLLFVRNVNPG